MGDSPAPSADADLQSWLAWKSLDSYLPALAAFGVESVPDLGELSDEELRGRGLNGPAVRRVRDLVRAFAAAQQ